MIKVALLTIGSELLDGRTLDTNVNFLAKELSLNSFSIINIMTCGDDLDSITAALSFVYQQGAELVITSGGLGPTTDDLTREAVAKYFQKELSVNQDELIKQKQRYLDRGKEFPISNIKQATFPETAIIIKNNFGTAPAFFISDNQHTLATLPGVPKELKGIFKEELLPFLIKHFNPPSSFQSRFVFFNIPESALNDQVTTLSLPLSIEVIYETSFPENRLIFKSTCVADLQLATKQIYSLPAMEFLVSNDQRNLSEVIHQKLLASGYTLSIAESCTGGLLSKTITDWPDSSNYFLGSIVSYNNSVKEDLLGVEPQTLLKHGAVSAETALAMALGVREELQTDIAIAITGIAGPTGGSDLKPVGTVFVSYVDRRKTITKEIFFSGTREQIRLYATYYALSLILKELF